MYVWLTMPCHNSNPMMGWSILPAGWTFYCTCSIEALSTCETAEVLEFNQSAKVWEIFVRFTLLSIKPH